MPSKTRKDFGTEKEYREYRDKRNKKERDRRAKDRPGHNKKERDRRAKDRPGHNKKEREQRAKIQLEALTAYSEGDPHCLHCGESQIEFLTLDHISGRASMGHAKYIKGHSLYSLLKREGYPPGMQVLCWNWNSIKGMKDRWRQSPTTEDGIKRKKKRYQVSLEVLTHYCSGKKPYCVCCGYDELDGLTMDHILGRKSGKYPKNEAKAEGDELRALLKKKNFPPNYQVLCSNCNSAKSDNAFCPGRFPHTKK